MDEELWQLYDELGQPIAGKGATRLQAAKGLRHATAHIWIWRRRGDTIEVLLQRRGYDRKRFAGMLDVSAAGHTILGETPLETMSRETKEELGLDIKAADVQCAGVCDEYVRAATFIENEFQWLYLLELENTDGMRLPDSEVESVEWKELSALKAELASDKARQYVPHSPHYFAMLLAALQRLVEVPAVVAG